MLSALLFPALAPEYWQWKERNFYDERDIGLEQTDARNFQHEVPQDTSVKSINILSIDGGGVFGIIPATILAKLTECVQADTPGRELWQDFNVIAGNSTGSIIAAGLVSKVRSTPPYALTAAELAQVYLQDAKKIFPPEPPSMSGRLSKVLFGKSLYHNEDRLNVIGSYLGYALSKDALTDFLIPFYDINSGPIYYTRNHGAHERTFRGAYTDFSESKFVYMADLVMYSSAAPIYFSPFRGRDTQTRIDIGKRRLPGYVAYDGALYQNNPTLLAIMEARRNDPNARLNVLSLGDGVSYRGSMLGPIDFKEPKNNVYSLVLLPAFMEGEARAVDEYLRSDPNISYTRIDVPIPPGTSLSMDDASDEHMQKLLRIAGDAAASASMEISTVCNQLRRNRQP